MQYTRNNKVLSIVPRKPPVPNNITVEIQNNRPSPFLRQKSIHNFLQRPSQVKEHVPNALPTKKLNWGPPIWTFFHTLAEKVKADRFPEIATEIIQVISTICSNLPCPDCSNHASIYLRENFISTVKTKEQLKTFLYEFHNSVNVRKSEPVFQRAELETKYKSAHFVRAWNQFLAEYSKKRHNARLMTHDFHRDSTIQFLKSWVQRNLNCFDLPS